MSIAPFVEELYDPTRYPLGQDQILHRPLLSATDESIGWDRWYIALEDARYLLEERRVFRKAIEECWKAQGFAFPQAFLQEAPAGFVSRHLATARYEDCAFILMAESVGLRPIWSTYIQDRFVTHSPIKGSYLLPRIVAGFSPRGFPEIRKVILADTQAAEKTRQPLNEIFTGDNESLVSWHQNLLHAAYPQAVVTDPSDIYKARGGAKEYYPLLLSLAVAHGILFEDFHGGETGAGLQRFTREIFEPAFCAVQGIFGASPLIVPLPWWRELGYYVDPRRADQWRRDRVILKHLLP